MYRYMCWCERQLEASWCGRKDKREKLTKIEASDVLEYKTTHNKAKFSREPKASFCCCVSRERERECGNITNSNIVMARQQCEEETRRTMKKQKREEQWRRWNRGAEEDWRSRRMKKQQNPRKKKQNSEEEEAESRRRREREARGLFFKKKYSGA